MNTPTTSTDTLSSYNPSTGEVVGTVPVTPAHQVDAVIAKARAAMPAWAALSAQQRADMLKPAGEKILERADELGRILSLEQGKPLAEGIGEITGCGNRMNDEVDEVAKAMIPDVLTLLRSIWCVCNNHPLELPRIDATLDHCSCFGRGQYRDPQAFGTDSIDR